MNPPSQPPRSVPPGAAGVSVRFGRNAVELQLGKACLSMPPARYAAQVRTDVGRRGLLESLASEGGEALPRPSGGSETADLPPDLPGASDSGGSGAWESVPLLLGSAWLLRPIGRGMFGEVYEALDLDDNRNVAVKLLRMWDTDAVSRFKREFRNLARVDHPNLIAPDEQGFREGGWWWFSMELVEGVDFLDYVRRGPDDPLGPGLRTSRLIDALRQLVDAVAALHNNSLLHLDLKARNVLVRPDRSVAVLDFGLSEPLQYHPDGTRTASTGFRGTPGYIAPEILQRQPPGTAADWYSLGALLFRVLADTPPNPDGPEERFDLLDPEAPEPLRALVRDLLAPDPERRPIAEQIRERLGLVPSVPDERDRPRPEFVGRERSLAVLERCLARVRAGRPVRAVVAGAPGIGKTALVEHFLGAAVHRSPSPLVLRGRCYERQAIPYNGFDQVMEAFGEALSRMDLFDAAQLLGKEVQELKWIFPAVGLDRAGEEAMDFGAALPVERRQRAFRAVKTVLRRASADRPLILFLDDVQWGDVDTVELLLEIVSPPEPCALLLILAVRHPEGQGSAFLSHWEASTASAASLPIERVPLQALDEQECTRLARRGLGSMASEDTVSALVRSAQGVPYWLDALIAEVQRGQVFAEGEHISVPDLVGARLDELDEETRLVLDLVAFAGRPIDQETLLLATGAAATKRSIHLLRRSSLIREIGLAPDDLLEAWHDRVREAVVGRAEPERATRLHGSLARALEQQGAAAEELSEHHHGAGDLARAADFAIVAAEEAGRQLAFGRAAGLLQKALGWGDFAAARRRELVERRAEHLHNGGHCSAAAREFSSAAQGAAPAQVHALRARAADAWLSAGEVDLGMSSLEPVFAELSVRRSGSALRTAVVVLRDLVRLLLRGPDPRPSAQADDRETQRIDLCWSVGKGLVPVIPLEGTAFMLQSLHRALSVGDRQRAARVLGFMSVFLFQLPGLRGIGQRYLAHARSVGDEAHDAYLQAATELWTAATHVFSGNWRAMGDAAHRAVEVFDGRCAGVSWERGMASGFAVWALQFRGELVECGEVSEAGLLDASRRGDLYGQVLFRQYLSMVRLAAGDVAGARGHADRVAADWMETPYTVPRFYAMWLNVTADLYEGDVDRAEERVVVDLAAFRAAGGRRLPMWRIDMALLEARIVLAANDQGRAVRSLSSLGRTARLLDGESRADGPAHGRMIRAAMTAQNSDGPRSLALLSEAIELYRAADMRLFESSARLRRAALLGDPTARDEAIFH